MKAAALTILLCCGLAHLAQAQSVGSIDSCLRRLDPQADVGYERVAFRCPDLIRQLEQGAWSMWLPRGWNAPGNDLSAGSLKELRELASWEPHAPPVETRPDVRRLAPILAQLDVADPNGGHWWKRFMAWLRSVARSQAQSERESESWLTRMIARVGPSEAILKLLAYTALGLVLALASAVVLNELRVAGLLRALPFKWARACASQVASRPGVHWSQIESAPLHERPSRLLEAITRRLVEHGCLPPSGALTVRELLQQVRLPEADRARLGDLALAAELLRYSEHDVSADRLEAVLTRGRAILEQLAAGAAPTALPA